MPKRFEHVPEVQRLGRDLADNYRLPGKEWNICANLVCYRIGEDHMAWNSNCKQCIIIYRRRQNCIRPILIRPKVLNSLQSANNCVWSYN